MAWWPDRFARLWDYAHQLIEQTAQTAAPGGH